MQRICHYFDLDSAKVLAHSLVSSLVSSRLNYCNSHLSGIVDTDLPKLQQCSESTGPRCDKATSIYSHSGLPLRSLHWLPVKFRIVFKITLLTYKTAFTHLHSMLARLLPSRSLRSNKRITLLVPMVKTNAGARTFHSCAPSLWNNVLLSVHSASSAATFRKCLKTHLFDLAFPPSSMAHWCYGTVSSSLLLNTYSAVVVPSWGCWRYINFTFLFLFIKYLQQEIAICMHSIHFHMGLFSSSLTPFFKRNYITTLSLGNQSAF